MSRKNIQEVVIDKKVESSFSILSNVIESINNENDELIGGSLLKLIKNSLDTYNIANEEMTKEIFDWFI